MSKATPSASKIDGVPADRICRFMAVYVKTGDVRAAARSAKITLADHYRMLAESESYAAEFDLAQAQVIGLLEAEAFRRALAGSDQLLVFLLRAWIPDLYGERTAYEHSGSVSVSDAGTPAEEEVVRRLIAIDRAKVQ